MSELSVRIADHRTGAYIATRTANTVDDVGHQREIQLVNLASRRLDPHPLRGIGVGVAVADDDDLMVMPPELFVHLVKVGDTTRLQVNPFHLVNNGECTITPIIFRTTEVTSLTTSSSTTSSSSTTTTSNSSTSSTSSSSTSTSSSTSSSSSSSSSTSSTSSTMSSTSMTTTTSTFSSTSTTLPYEIVGILESKDSDVGATIKFKKGDEYLSPTLEWDVSGAELIGIHISAIGGSGNSLRLTGGVF